jgi:hypothetical protein
MVAGAPSRSRRIGNRATSPSGVSRIATSCRCQTWTRNTAARHHPRQATIRASTAATAPGPKATGATPCAQTARSATAAADRARAVITAVLPEAEPHRATAQVAVQPAPSMSEATSVRMGRTFVRTQEVNSSLLGGSPGSSTRAQTVCAWRPSPSSSTQSRAAISRCSAGCARTSLLLSPQWGRDCRDPPGRGDRRLPRRLRQQVGDGCSSSACGTRPQRSCSRSAGRRVTSRSASASCCARCATLTARLILLFGGCKVRRSRRRSASSARSVRRGAARRLPPPASTPFTHMGYTPY